MGMTDARADAEALVAPWPGPHGGLPPFDRASAHAIEVAIELGIERKREEVRAIVANAAAPTFANTVLALERSGFELARARCFLTVYRSTMLDDVFKGVLARVLPKLGALDDEILHDDALFARVAAVSAAAESADLSGIDARLLRVVHDRFVRAGADLEPQGKRRLAEINRRLSSLENDFTANLVAVQRDAVFVEDERELDGLDAEGCRRAAEAATALGREGAWGIANTFEAVWPFLTQAKRRDLRERVWRMSDQRAITDGPNDNRPIAAEILQLRAEKARLLGYRDFASFTMADRMQTQPKAMLDLIERVWTPVVAATREQLDELQGIADDDGEPTPLAPWDRRYYTAKLRQRRFAFSADDLKPYLSIESVLAAMFAAAESLLGITRTELSGVPTCDPSVRVFELHRGDATLGILYLDVVPRAGKMRGSWQAEYRSAEGGDAPVIPIASLNSNPPPAAEGEPTLLAWEHANVFFHEFGHVLHMLCNRAPYPSLGSMAAAWDFIELPSLLNERWLLNRDLLKRFFTHHETGAAIPDAMVEGLFASLNYERSFTLNLDTLASSIVDLRLHQWTGEARPDVQAIERQVFGELDVPDAVDVIQHAAASFHVFGGGYAAGFYSYLWSDVMAADIADVFTEAPGGLYDREVSNRYVETLLSVGNMIPAGEAFRQFRGRDPDPTALLGRFGLTN